MLSKNMISHYLILGDLLKILPKIKEGIFDAVIVDPPYRTANKNIKELKGRKAMSADFGEWDYFKDDEYLQFCDSWLHQCSRILKKSGNLLTFCKLEYVSDIRRIYEKLGFKHHGTIIWHKTNSVPKIRKTGFLSSCEAILWATKGFDEKKISYTFNFSTQKEMHNFIESPICMGSERTPHPTQKPLKVVRHLVKIFTNKDDLILDCFAGSGTLAIAAEELGRRSFNMEIDNNYFKLMKKRVIKKTKNLFSSPDKVSVIDNKKKLKEFLTTINKKDNKNNNPSPSSNPSEEEVIIALAEFLDENNWEIVACHPPGGHTSFSILDGRRSKGGYMPDVVAIQENQNSVPIVIIAECKPSYNETDKDIEKLKNLSDIHADWIGFRLQNYLNRELWIKNWRNKLQKIIGIGDINDAQTIQKDLIENPDLIVINTGEDPIQFFVGKNAPAKDFFSKS